MTLHGVQKLQVIIPTSIYKVQLNPFYLNGNYCLTILSSFRDDKHFRPTFSILWQKSSATGRLQFYWTWLLIKHTHQSS